jgi:hypothetical protein
MDAIVDLGYGGVIADRAEGIHDDLALRRQAVTLFTYLFVIVDLVVGHRRNHPYCKFLQLQFNYNKDSALWQEDMA